MDPKDLEQCLTYNSNFIHIFKINELKKNQVLILLQKKKLIKEPMFSSLEAKNQQQVSNYFFPILKGKISSLFKIL